MQFKEIPLCYLPATIILIDDNLTFIKMIDLILSTEHVCRSFNDSQEALEWLSAQKSFDLSRQLVLISNEEYTSEEMKENILIDLASLHKIVYNPQRFLLPIVAVIDYAMPSISGIELCQQLRRHPIRKLMLTGNAQEFQAIEAFNAGIIHRFFFKNSEKKAVEKLKEAVREEKIAYFKQLSYQQFLPITKQIIEKPEFVALFNQIIHDYNIVEFYLLDKWGSYLMLTARGEMLILAVRDQEQCEAYYQIAKFADSDIDPDLLKKLEIKSHFPFFYEDYQIPVEQWQDHLHPAKALGEYYYTVIPHERVPSTFKKHPIESFQDYLSKEN